MLDRIYRLGGALAAFFLVMIALLTLLQIGGRLFHIQVRDADVFAGFAMAASSFLGLAYTLRTGGHIRVTLFISRIHGPIRRIIEGWCLLFAIVAVGAFAWFTLGLVQISYEYNDLSTGMIGVPLWIPQMGMLLGVALLELALLEEGLRFVRSEPQTYDSGDAEDFTE